MRGDGFFRAGTGALRLLACALTALAAMSAAGAGRVPDPKAPAELENAYPVEIRGVLIVEDASPPPFSRELVLVLDDWLLGRDLQIDPRFNTGRDLSHDGRWGNYITVNGERRPQLEVRPGERLRLRLINVANGRVFAPDFGGLDHRVIAVDGLYTARPLDFASLELQAPQRATAWRRTSRFSGTRCSSASRRRSRSAWCPWMRAAG